MGRLAVVGSSVGVWSLCTWYGVPRQARVIEQDVHARCSAALSSAGLPSSGLLVDGREVWLTGTRSSPQTSETTVDLLKAVPGVHAVRLNVLPDPVVVVPEHVKVERAIAGLLERSPLNFTGSRAALGENSRHTLDEVAELLRQAPAFAVAIEAGGRTAELGRRRAQSIQQYLIGRGLVASRLSAKGRAAGNQVEFKLREVE